MKRMADRIHYLMDEIEPPRPDESLQSDKDGESRRRFDRTLFHDKYNHIKYITKRSIFTMQCAKVMEK
jgi:HD superfamily phosphohydrolase YqeK